ncbi:hypothetical protein H072_4843 [Dactylellina haptotyla CBS 200.50]|uniref:Uncharacterized protein n=1 Tax=Dactylellina haptotyla (strain CBS 200.50) TaxID=1284197 RepID=S8AEG5_DACHA|nr:hypothetical protein H072_4843 [Dactylellina haptotyla CBS 200.50]
MKSRYMLAGAGLLHIARAIPAYITTVFSCPDVVTITQTVYPPGWTNTGPVYTTLPLTEPRPQNPPENPPPQQACTETGLTTSWETEYATRTVYYSEYGMYQGPPGCPSTIIAYMPTTVTCSEPQTTGWVGYASDIACASCTATTLVGVRPSVSGTNTYYTVWTEVYVEAGTTTRASSVGGQWVTSGTAPPYAAPYAKQCTSTAYNGGGNTYNSGGNTYYTGAAAPTRAPGGGYPSLDYSNPSVFRAGESIPIYSAGYTPATGAPSSPYPTPAGTSPAPSQGGPYTWTRGGGYPSINYDDPNVFQAGASYAPSSYPGGQAPPPTYTAGPEAAPSTTGAPPNTSAPPATGTVQPSGRVLSSYPPNYDDPNVFRAPTGGIEIVSLTERISKPAPTPGGYSVASNYGSNYASIDPNATENFRPPTGTVGIVTLDPPQTFPPPITTSIPIITRATSAYPSIDFSNPSVFAGPDPNARIAGSGSGSAPPAATSSAAPSSAAPSSARP